MTDVEQRPAAIPGLADVVGDAALGPITPPVPARRRACVTISAGASFLQNLIEGCVWRVDVNHQRLYQVR